VSQGIKGEWRDLPSRHCLNCETLFQPRVPWQKFCRRTTGNDPGACRKQYHRHGGAYHKLKPEIQSLVEQSTARELQLMEARMKALEALANPPS